MSPLLMAILSAWYSHLWIQKILWSHFFNMVGAALLFHFIVFSGVVPALSRIHVSTAIAREISELSIKPSSIAAAGYQEPSLVFLLGKDLLLVDPREAASKSWWRGGPGPAELGSASGGASNGRTRVPP